MTRDRHRQLTDFQKAKEKKITEHKKEDKVVQDCGTETR